MNDRKTRAVVLLSGGIDSSAVLGEVMLRWNPVFEYIPVALGVDYKQRHIRELDAAENIARYFGVPFTRARVDYPGECALLGGLGELTGPDTVVPGRNMMMISVAAGVAKCSAVYLGCHAGDADLYPDCRHEFIGVMDQLTRKTYGVNVRAPFIEMSKVEVLKRAIELGVPLGMTWSCYAGGDAPCEKCGACMERRSALAAVGR